MSLQIDWRIIDRHLAGDATPADDAALARWLTADPRHAELLNELRAAASEGTDAARWNVDAAWSALRQRTESSRPTRAIPLRARDAAQPRRVASRVARNVTGIAAACAAAVALVVVWGSKQDRHSPTTRGESHEIVAANGQQTRATLRDGSRVVLNAGSRLRYDDSFGTTSRDVDLVGEGYFEVVHDSTRPFRVHARDGVAEDLGTRFVVRAYAEVPHIEVVVAEGRVALSHDTPDAPRSSLTPGQLGRVESDGSVTVQSDADLDDWTGWTRGALSLDGLSLGDAALEISRRFDVHVVVPESALAQRRVSARFHDESLSQVLDALDAALGARWTRDGQTITIRSAR